MTKKQREKKRLAEEMHITATRGDTWTGLRPKAMTNAYYKTNKQSRRENAAICRMAMREQG